MSAATVLLVEDDEVLNRVLARVLGREGYRVVEARSAAEALRAARSSRPAVGLLDLCLPDGDGRELARQLEADPGPFPLILMTAYPLRLREDPTLTAAFTRVLTKPVDLDDLRQALQAARREPTTLPATPTLRHDNMPRLTDSPGPLAKTPSPTAPAEKGRRRLPLLLAGVAVLAVAGLVLALPALGLPGLPDLVHREAHSAPAAPPEDPLRPRLEGANTLVLSPAAVARLGLTTAVVSDRAAPRRLELSGSLAFDPNRLGRIQARFGGEVVEVGHNQEPGPDPRTGRTEAERPLRYGDHVRQGQLMAVVWSKDLGEKKSELVDALVQLKLDRENLAKVEQLYGEGASREADVRQARRAVSGDLNAASRSERTLRIWKLSDEEIQAVKEEAKRIDARQGGRNQDREKDWARVEVRAPFDGVVVEKNVHLGNMVDTTFDLFKIADLRTLAVYCHAYEEDLRTLNSLQSRQWPIPWKVRLTADPSGRVLSGAGIDQIGFVVDPSQHTGLVMGRVDNPRGALRAGQFVTATVEVPAPAGVVSVPPGAVVEDGNTSVVFVQSDPAQPRYILRQVTVTRRFRDTVYVRSRLTGRQNAAGLTALRPGDRVVTAAAVELKGALEDLQARAHAHEHHER